MNTTDKKFDLDKVKQSVKKQQKKETNMKKVIIITVTVTLILVAAQGAFGFFLYQKGASDERAKYESVKAEVKALTAKEVSKQ